MNVAVFGAGNVAGFLLKHTTRPGINVSYICDNERSKWNSDFMGFRVFSPEHLIEEPVDKVIVAVKKEDDIFTQLVSMGIDVTDIILFNEEKSGYFPSEVDSLFRIPKKSLEDDIFTIISSLNDIKEMIGRIECRQIESLERIEKSEFKVFSQNREDGIIQYLIRHISISDKRFIEFGVQNYVESNTRFLLLNNNWTGMIIDGDPDNINYIKNDDIYMKYNLTAINAFISAENINSLIEESGFGGHIGLLSIDIDGNDYWVWEAINVVDPDIVICEYNPRFGCEKAVTIPYDPEWTRYKVSYTGVYFGASIKALEKLGNKKGYALVASDSHGANLFFVKKTLLNDYVKEVSAEQAYVRNQYRDSRDRDGKLNYLSFDEVTNEIKDLPLINV